jgi:hypothetical protein
LQVSWSTVTSQVAREGPRLGFIDRAVETTALRDGTHVASRSPSVVVTAMDLVAVAAGLLGLLGVLLALRRDAVPAPRG